MHLDVHKSHPEGRPEWADVAICWLLPNIIAYCGYHKLCHLYYDGCGLYYQVTSTICALNVTISGHPETMLMGPETHLCSAQKSDTEREDVNQDIPWL